MQDLNIILAKPRGFCAGVDRAIQIVELAIKKYGAPVYVRHEIVHNRFVVESLEKKGAIFVQDVSDVPSDRPVIFSAHGVPKSVPQEAVNRKMIYVDATCPLVSKVHKEVERHVLENRTVILIGHKNHPEVIGTMGQVNQGAIVLVETLDDVSNLNFSPTKPLAYATQTTLSVEETDHIIKALQKKFPHIVGPYKQDICYATTNRQLAVKAIAAKVDAMIVIGSVKSSNSQRLVEVAKQSGCHRAILLERAEFLDWHWFKGVKTLGITAGASAPEVLVEEVITACKTNFNVIVQEEDLITENIIFHPPKYLINTPQIL